MKTFNILGLAIASTLAFAPAAFAQDSTETASGKHWAVVGGVALLQPDSNPAKGTDIDGGPAPTLSASYYVNDNWAVELWGAADKFNHRVKQDGAKVGTIEQQPVALSGQDHFGSADATFRPFVGVGYYESNFSNEDIGEGVGIETAKGAIGTVGVDMNINSTWFARVDARYMDGDADVKQAGESTGTNLTLNPWTVGVGLGARF